MVTVTLDAECNEETTDLTSDAAMDVASKIQQSVSNLLHVKSVRGIILARDTMNSMLPFQ